MKALMKYTSLFLGGILIATAGNTANLPYMNGGGGHFLTVISDGTVWAWGGNAWGQLGDGTTEARLTPVQVSGLTDMISVGAGFGHSLALKRDGTVWAWGWNVGGELGDGTVEERHTPVKVIGLSGVTAIAIDSSYYYSVPYSLAVKNDGTAWAWGSNNAGQLGDGTTEWRLTPVQVVGLSEVIAISGGDSHSIALKRDGTVWAWGGSNLTPVQVSGLSDVISISTGGGHSLALKQDGTVWAWGNNWEGQLGDGNGGGTSYTNSLTPVQSLVSGIIAIAGGEAYSLALTSYGTVWFWGRLELDMGPLPGDSIQSKIPIPVDISGVKAIASGHNRALALKNDGTLWAWGEGYLGDGTTHGTMYPVQVQGLSLAASSAPASVLAADFDADGRADPTAVDGAGQWYFWHSSQSYSRDGPIDLGMTGMPVAGDVDGDGIGDMALADNSGNWFFWLSSRGYTLAEAQFLPPSAYSLQPVLADFDGDGKADPAIVDSLGNWYIWLSADRYTMATAQFLPSSAYSLQPLAADFDGDGKADPVMVSSSGNWYFWLSGSMFIRNGPFNFGLNGTPVAGDFDGDGKADPAIMDSSGNWFFWLSGSFYTRDGPYYLVLP